jgi:DNA-binding NarL/FixJ family response regulator
MRNLHLAIVDDNLPLAHALREELLNFPAFEKITVHGSGLGFVQALSLAKERVPDVILMDISMRLADEGIQATRVLYERYPDCRVIIFTVNDDNDRIFDAFKAGAVGYLLKNERSVFIYKTILDVANGGALMSPSVARKAIGFLSAGPPEKRKEEADDFQLTERELEVLRWVAKGNTYVIIADELCVTTETVKKHLSNIFKKMRVKNRIEAINKAKEIL